MTGQEALKEIFNIIYNLDCGTTFEQDKKLNECRDVLKRVIFNAEKSLKALEILKEHIKFEDKGIEKYTDDSKNLVTKFLIRLESKDTGATFHIHLDTEEELDTIKEGLE